VRALVKLRCENLEQANKYWLEKKLRRCIFCEEGMEYFVIDCRKTREWFMVLGDDKDKILEKIWENLENIKDSLLKKLWKEREKELKKKRTLREREGEVKLLEEGLE